MRIIAEHAAGKVLKRDALQIGAEAKAAKQKDPKVIDATIGTFLSEDCTFKAFKTVKNIVRELPDDKFYTYSTSDGGTDFQNAVLNWVFDNRRAEIESKMFCRALPTPGGTGALSNAIFNSLDHGQSLLIPNLYWGPYVGIANNFGLSTEKFELFEGDHFNMANFYFNAERIIEKQKKLVVVINDPCNNPTGYTLSLQELETIIDYLNSKENTPCIFIYDIAYFDFNFEGRNKTREKFSILTKANPNVMIAIAFSGSKTFASYGQRLGSLILLGKDTVNMTEMFNACNFTARNFWSNCNKAMINLMITFDQNPTLKQQFLVELDEVVETLRKRADLFLKEAKKIGLITHPYHSGFFVTIPVKNNDLVLQELVEKEKMYLLPFEKSIRLALCALPLNCIPNIASRIKKVIDSVE